MRALSNMPISFPGLFGDWEFTAGPKALDIGNGIYWYGIFIALGVILAVLFCCSQRKKYGVTEDNIYDLVLWAVPLCVIGARIYYVIFYLDLYRNSDGSFNWGDAIAIWDGGLAIYGGVIMAIAVLTVFSRCRKISFAAYADLGVQGLLIGQAMGRWGNFMNREAFGGETTLPWRMRLWTSATEYIEVHPTFLYESLWNLLGLLIIVLVISRRRRFDGENMAFYFAWYGLGRFWIEGLRTDSLYLFDWTFAGEPIRVSQALSLVLLAGAVVYWCYMTFVRKPTPDMLFVNRLAAQAAETEETAVAEVVEKTAEMAEELAETLEPETVPTESAEEKND